MAGLRPPRMDIRRFLCFRTCGTLALHAPNAILQRRYASEVGGNRRVSIFAAGRLLAGGPLNDAGVSPVERKCLLADLRYQCLR